MFRNLWKSKAKAAEGSNETGFSKKTILALKAALKSANLTVDHARLSKKYILNQLKVDIGKRGGIIIVKDKDTGGYSLWAVIKTKEPQDKRPAGRALLLGEPGGMGKVKKIENLETQEQAALKVLHKLSEREGFKREAENLAYFGKGYGFDISKLYTEAEMKERLKSGGDREGKPCIIMDLAPGKDLFEVLKEGGLSALERIDVFVRAMQEVQGMHERQRLHLDIKPENIKYDKKTKTITVIDFGLMRSLDDLPSLSVGTRDYMAPEVLAKQPRYSEATDVFAFAGLARDLFGIEMRDKRRPMVVNLGNPDNKAAASFSQEERALIQNLIQRMEKPDRGDDKRISLPEAIEAAEAFRAEWLRKHKKKAEIIKINAEEKQISTRQREEPIAKSVIQLAALLDSLTKELESFSTQPKSDETRKAAASSLVQRLREQRKLLIDKSATAPQKAMAARIAVEAIEEKMWKLFKKINPEEIKRGLMSRIKKSKNELSIKDIFANSNLDKMKALTGKLETFAEGVKERSSRSSLHS